ncbi:MAG TPA: AarF/UbiB family protein [Bryobacteraceae bacterium]|nr:AarF/UbiB family protein [Bryobacteraceae bacterium]
MTGLENGESTGFDSSLLTQFLAGVTSTVERIQAVEDVLKTAGASWRNLIGPWITRLVPAQNLVPERHQDLRPLVEDAFQFVFSRLSDHRLAVKLVEQVEMPVDAPPETRLIKLIAKMPGLQKLGQVLARNRRLSPALREALSELENSMADVGPEEMTSIIASQLGSRMQTYQVEIEPAIFKEGSASAILRFTWRNPGKESDRGVFKVLKPYVVSYFAEDMTLLQQLGEYLSTGDRQYGFAVRDLKDLLAEVRLLLEHELDVPLEQRTLGEAREMYRSSIGIRVPRLVAPLCTPQITAMTQENGVKVTEACPRSPIRRLQIAVQLIEAIVAVPLFSRQDPAVFHADPHAGNLLYDEPNRELMVLDWALADRLSVETRRRLVMLVLMMNLRNRAGVCEAIQALSESDPRPQRDALIEEMVTRFFEQFPADRSPGTLDAMRVLDEIALEGVHFPAPLFLFRKILFTLDGVLQDVAGSEVRIDHVITREFVSRGIASFGLFHSPLSMKDLGSIQWNALLYPTRLWARKRLRAGTA